ncbi:MAG: hypothetical protein A3G81_31140 [Betaproteobacteria bacterium RIFCSPLOWO2_12_FULL_65_14]|nr:MAG: hypothetical protein A3G81_31140 [Betaproteobacteria bacterium RIFCSPLOWO2_12_FULL_65_14]
MQWEYAMLGLAAGVLVGISGVGGGSLVTPALTIFGVPAAVAVGTDLAFAAITKAFGTVVHRAQGSVDWRTAGLLAAGSCPAAALTVALLGATGMDAHSRLITVMLSIALILTALSLCLDRSRVARAALRAGERLKRYRGAMTVAAGISLGVLVTLSSIGAGALGAMFLVVLHPRLAARRIAATDIAHAVPLTLVAGAGHLWLGTVDGALLASLLAGSIPGIVLSSLLAGRLPERLVRSLLALVLFAAGTRFALSAA